MSHANARKLRATMTDAERLADIEKRIAALERGAGKAGNGSCICIASPFQRWREAFRMVEDPRANKIEKHYRPILDHRCPHHGEKAQPKLWGRHKEKTLQVSWAEWDSLGICYTPDDDAARGPFDGAAAMAAARTRGDK